MRIEPRKWTVAMCCGALLAAGSAQAQLVTLTFDENGNSTGLTGETYVSSFSDSESSSVNSQSEPSGGGASTLTYLTPLGGVFGGVSGAYPQLGWVAVYAYGTPSSDYGTTTGLLDLIHFDNSYQPDGTLYDKMFFFSLEGSGNLANYFPNPSQVSTILGYTYLQSVTENANGDTFYTPSTLANNAAYAAGYSVGSGSPQQYTYEFESSVVPVPEPTTILSGALLLLPFGASTLRILRRNRAA